MIPISIPHPYGISRSRAKSLVKANSPESGYRNERRKRIKSVSSPNTSIIDLRRGSRNNLNTRP